MGIHFLKHVFPALPSQITKILWKKNSLCFKEQSPNHHGNKQQYILKFV